MQSVQPDSHTPPECTRTSACCIHPFHPSMHALLQWYNTHTHTSVTSVAASNQGSCRYSCSSLAQPCRRPFTPSHLSTNYVCEGVPPRPGNPAKAWPGVCGCPTQPVLGLAATFGAQLQSSRLASLSLAHHNANSITVPTHNVRTRHRAC